MENIKSVKEIDLNSLTKEELIDELENSRLETFKYVNKFLELEEKWEFTNFLLKKLNSIKQKTELCKTICEGFLRLTNSKLCLCCLFNPDKNAVEIQKMATNGDINLEELGQFIDWINLKCFAFLENTFCDKKILDYFRSISAAETIVVPIIYAKNLLGYLMLKKEDKKFYDENINFINIFPEHIALILENISLYQESEKQNKRKVEFLAGISHEFKTPLNSIIGFSEIIRLGAKSQDEIKYINNILHSSKHLLSLIEDVIDVSKSQYKLLELNYTNFNPKNEILQILRALEEMIKSKNINVNYTLSDIEISADATRFKQLIYNLVSNAIKFNKIDGDINIITYVKNNEFFFEIHDTGDGISKKDYEKIFNFFSQVNRSQLKRQLGSGIGLALCKKITDAHDGGIYFKSKIKKGSSFWFYLPIKRKHH